MAQSVTATMAIETKALAGRHPACDAARMMRGDGRFPDLAGAGMDVMDQHERARRAATARQAAGDLAARDVTGVAVTWVDTSGVTRVKAVPLTRLEHAAAWGIGMSPVFDAFLLDDSIVSGRYAGGPVGDLRLHPDLDRLAVLPALPGRAWAPADRYDQDG